MGKKGKLQSSYFTFSKASLINKYVLVTIAFLVWMLFFDKNGIPTNLSLKNNIETLESTKAEYEQKIVEALVEKKEIEENKEKYAREKYLMHKENEDVIVIEKKTK